MIWDKKTCPICDKDLRVTHGVDTDPVYFMKCFTPFKIPEKHRKLLQGSGGENNFPHFELEFQNHKPCYQVVRVYPYCIKSYPEASNIYIYDINMYARFIAETPFIDLPWKDEEKIVKKLSTYSLFS